jgi:carbon monoxide dehydrogenase subunit G
VTATGSIEIDAPVDHVFATITDFDNVASWQSQCLSSVVEERDEQGRGTVVKLQIDMKIKQPSYRNRYNYAAAPNRLTFNLIDGEIKKAEGSYTLDAVGDRTKVTYSADVDPGFYVPGPVRKKVAQGSINDLLSQLKNRAESTR